MMGLSKKLFAVAASVVMTGIVATPTTAFAADEAEGMETKMVTVTYSLEGVKDIITSEVDSYTISTYMEGEDGIQQILLQFDQETEKMMMSKDGGKTWEEAKEMEFSYTAILENKEENSIDTEAVRATIVEVRQDESTGKLQLSEDGGITWKDIEEEIRAGIE